MALAMLFIVLRVVLIVIGITSMRMLIVVAIVRTRAAGATGCRPFSYSRCLRLRFQSLEFRAMKPQNRGKEP